MRLITLPEHDVRTYRPPENVYGILAAPPCTEFSVAKGGLPRDFKSAMLVVSACVEIIWECRVKNTLGFWALENPRGFLRQFLGIPPFTFEQWEFGEQQIKPTDLWGYYNFPRKTVTIKPENLTVKFGSRINGRGWANPKPPTQYENLGLDRAAIRAITPPGFAQAFFKANP